jgi:acetoin utilization deacetylase AcuC-like enzyme
VRNVTGIRAAPKATEYQALAAQALLSVATARCPEEYDAEGLVVAVPFVRHAGRRFEPLSGLYSLGYDGHDFERPRGVCSLREAAWQAIDAAVGHARQVGGDGVGLVVFYGDGSFTGWGASWAQLAEKARVEGHTFPGRAAV